MNHDPNFALLRRTLIALAACAALVAVSYFFVDRPLAFFVERHRINQIHWLKWLTYPPPIVQTWSPLVIAIIVIRRTFGPLARWQHILLMACLSLIVADQFCASMGLVCGRDWPETWRNHNPSLIGTGAYGFYPFPSGEDVGSFPSGHAARILGFLSVWWIAAPRGRLLYAIVAVPMLLSLIGMNYHFVGDVIAGCFVGGMVGVYAAHLGGLSAGGRGVIAAS